MVRIFTQKNANAKELIIFQEKTKKNSAVCSYYFYVNFDYNFTLNLN